MRSSWPASRLSGAARSGGPDPSSRKEMLPKRLEPDNIQVALSLASVGQIEGSRSPSPHAADLELRAVAIAFAGGERLSPGDRSRGDTRPAYGDRWPGRAED